MTWCGGENWVWKAVCSVGHEKRHSAHAKRRSAIFAASPSATARVGFASLRMKVSYIVVNPAGSVAHSKYCLPLLELPSRCISEATVAVYGGDD